MANPEHVAKLKEGLEAWNEWRQSSMLRFPDLIGVHLHNRDIHGANLDGARLSNANLHGANLSSANLHEADLSNAILHATYLKDTNLTGAALVGAEFKAAKLAGANLKGANLSNANFMSADLTGANLTAARLYVTVFARTNLTGAFGLETCIHGSFSILDTSTLEQSGMLPVSFLRGCGLPENLINYLPSLINQAIQFYSCFISYSSHDQAFASTLISAQRTFAAGLHRKI